MAKERPQVDSAGQKELDKAEKQFEAFDNQVKELTMDRMNQTPKADREEAKVSSKDLEKSNDLYMKPVRTISCKEKFNEKYRDEYNYAKEYVPFVPKHYETSDKAEFWTKPFAGVPAEFWQLPVDRTVYAPRYVEEQLKKCAYRRLSMDQKAISSSDGLGHYFGSMVVDTTVQRLDALAVSTRKSIFMGSKGF